MGERRKAMSLPEIEQHRVDKLLTAFCDRRVPLQVRDEVMLTYKITGNKVFLIETRPYFDDPSQWTEMRIAQFEFDAADMVWSLYAYNRNNKRMPYSKGPLDQLIQEVDKDPTGIFWG
jgi:hypothetical protein